MKPMVTKYVFWLMAGLLLLMILLVIGLKSNGVIECVLGDYYSIAVLRINDTLDLHIEIECPGDIGRSLRCGLGRDGRIFKELGYFGITSYEPDELMFQVFTVEGGRLLVLVEQHAPTLVLLFRDLSTGDTWFALDMGEPEMQQKGRQFLWRLKFERPSIDYQIHPDVVLPDQRVFNWKRVRPQSGLLHCRMHGFDDREVAVSTVACKPGRAGR